MGRIEGGGRSCDDIAKFFKNRDFAFIRNGNQKVTLTRLVCGHFSLLHSFFAMLTNHISTLSSFNHKISRFTRAYAT